jgi:hypothetical protein
VRARAAEAEQVVDANLAAATPCCLDVSILLNCATGSAQAGDEDEARRLEAKADGLGMEGGRWYQGWFEPPRIRLALARHQTGKLAELAPADFDWEWEPVPTFLDAVAALGDRERIEAEAPKWLQEGSFGEPFALRARHRPRRPGAARAGAGAIRGHGAHLARRTDQTPAVKALGAGLAQDRYVASAKPGPNAAGTVQPVPWPVRPWTVDSRAKKRGQDRRGTGRSAPILPPAIRPRIPAAQEP